MPVFLGIASQISSSLCEAAGAFVPASATDIAASIAETVAQVVSTSQSTKKSFKRSKYKRSAPKPKPAPEDIVQWGRHILLLEPCWLRLPDSPEDFAHICLILQNGFGLQSGRSKLLICDSETDESFWVQRNATALYPFKKSVSSDPDFTAKFSKRPAHLDTQAFQEALQLAYMCSDQSNVNQGDALKLLMLGYMGRRHLVTKKGYFTSFEQLCEEARMQQKHRRTTQNLPSQANAQTPDEAIHSEKPQMKGARSARRTNNLKDSTALTMKNMTRKQLCNKSVITNRVAKNVTSSSLTKPIMKATGRSLIVQKHKIKAPAISKPIKCRNNSTAASLVYLKTKEKLSQHQTGDATTSSMPDPKASPKKQKRNTNEIDAQLTLSSTRQDAQPSVGSQPQIIQRPNRKAKTTSQGLCPHHVQPHNCPKCIKHNFTSWKPRASDDTFHCNL